MMPHSISSSLSDNHNPKMGGDARNALAVGIDIGGTNTDIGLVDAKGCIVCRGTLSTVAYTDFSAYIRDVVALAQSLLAKHREQTGDEAELLGFGIGAPNANFYTGCVVDAVNLPFKGVLDFGKEIRAIVDLPVVLDNDANAAAFGEYIYGGAKGMKHFIEFTLGTGVGSGIVVDGRIVHGVTGSAGELGHTILYLDGRMCGCGRKGCLEAYASARGVVGTYLDLRHANPSQEGALSHVADADLTCHAIGKAAQAGDPMAMQTWATTADYLGLAMANAVVFSSPEAIFLTGGPAQVGQPLFEPLQRAFDRYLLHCYRGSCTIYPSSLPTNEAALLGAASLLWHQ